MSKERSDKCRHLSKYGGGYINDAQALAEIMMERIAAKEKVALRDRFWEDKQWLNKYKLQIKHVSALLKEFGYDIVRESLNEFDMRNIYSFGLKSKFEPVCQRLKDRKEKMTRLAESNDELVGRVGGEYKPRPTFKGNGLRGKLDG